jgi:tetratricopeptide (TPR) repeat protein
VLLKTYLETHPDPCSRDRTQAQHATRRRPVLRETRRLLPLFATAPLDFTKLNSMHRTIGNFARAYLLALALALPASSGAQPAADEASPPPSSQASSQASLIASLHLPVDTADHLSQALTLRDYISAEKLLLPEIDRDLHSPRAARLLAFIGVIYFRNQDYPNAVVAWNKSAAIAPLGADLRFSLAMAYIHVGHPDWARPVLETLTGENPKDAVYIYWLGRLDYDNRRYPEATRSFQKAVELNPQMARAYDNLGLCYYYQNQNDLALANYQKAIDLDAASPHPSPWPYLNMAVTQQFLNQLPDAEKNLRLALRLDPGFAKAHFQLGTVFEDLKRPDDALAELREAARLDPSYAEPHMAMARVLHKLGQETPAREEVQTYLRLHPPSKP